MSTPSVRMLELLSVLQDGREHTGADLVARLGASPRTVRRDLDRLRELGYPVESRRGPGGAYRLVAGSAVPPLLFTDDEAVAAVVGLRLVGDAGEGALRKLERVLPSRLAHRVRAVSASVDAVSRTSVPVEAVQVLGAAIGARQDVRFTYVPRSGEGSRRRVEPVRQVVLGRRWYLLGWDRDRADWRTYRLDRISEVEVPGTTFAARELPDDPVSFVQASARVPISATRAVVRFAAPASVVSERLIPEAGAVEALGDDECRFVSAPDSWDWLAITLAMVGVPYVIEGPPELIARSREISSAMWRAAR
ncbi:helix-turn-helix transcriptional regulator [Actinomycetospora termitidis]|uniref:YafY family protein n=1 Tax=Actinomycetospora termitidis TaxID=3053470 RepID=A0ABT7M382_9PSEU|nr:YafY family protein [Actinomycetospora sp. Odt1-22]MDL5155122.1 YafY family protein [Actinomycetospora sp. Odt1-22]